MAAERFSSAPAYASVYSEDDYDPVTGRPKVLRPIPLGPYPLGVTQQLVMGTNQEGFQAPQMPTVPVVAAQEEEEEVVEDKPKVLTQEEKEQRAKEEEEARVEAAKRRRQMVSSATTATEFNQAVIGKRDHVDLVTRKPAAGYGHSAGFGSHVAAPPTSRDPCTPGNLLSKAHAWAVVSWIENRHPDEDAIMEHYYSQWKAKREGKYDPFEDPPVNLSDLVPKMALVVSRTFTASEVESDNGRTMQSYMEDLHRQTDLNIIPLECGKPQPFPISDRVRGIYKDVALQQTMDSFYSGQNKGAEDIMQRMEKDKAEGKAQIEEAKRLTSEERVKASSSSSSAAAAISLPVTASPTAADEKKKFWGDESDGEDERAPAPSPAPALNSSSERGVKESSETFWNRMRDQHQPPEQEFRTVPSRNRSNYRGGGARGGRRNNRGKHTAAATTNTTTTVGQGNFRTRMNQLNFI